MTSKTPEQQILDGQRIDAFRKDPVVREVFEGLEKVYFEEWKQADDPVVRDKVWAKARVLDDVARGLGVIIENGKGLQAARDRAEKKDKGTPKR